MRLAKTMGLACIAAIASMALLGTSTASAESTALCNVNKAPCPEESQTTKVHFVADDILIHTSAMDYECDALLTATVLKLGSPQTLDATSLQYTSCNQGCTRTVKALGTFSVLRTETDTATVEGNGFEVLVQCGVLINCTYAFKELTGTLTGASLTGNGHITYEEAGLFKVGGFACPAVANLNALFEALSSVYVTS